MEKTGAKLHDGKQDHHQDIDGGDQNVTVVMKIDMHCDECAGKLVKYVKSLHGVKSVAAGGDCKELTVSGTMDPCKLRRLLEEKTKKKAILFSLVTNVAESPTDDVESPAPAPTKTVVLRMTLHCNRCMKKIMQKLLTFEGVTAVTAMNLGNDLVTVVGNFDVKSLVTFLSHKLRRRVEVIEETINHSPVTKISDTFSASRKSTDKWTTAKTNKANSTGESVEKPTKLNDTEGSHCVTGAIPKMEEEEVVVASVVLKRAKNGGRHRLAISKGEKNYTEKSGKEETTTVAAPVETRELQAEMQEAGGYNHISYDVDMAYASEFFSDGSANACCIM